MQIQGLNSVASQLATVQNRGSVQGTEERSRSNNVNVTNSIQDTVELSSAARARPVTEPGNAGEEQSENRPDGDE